MLYHAITMNCRWRCTRRDLLVWRIERIRVDKLVSSIVNRPGKCLFYPIYSNSINICSITLSSHSSHNSKLVRFLFIIILIILDRTNNLLPVDYLALLVFCWSTSSISHIVVFVFQIIAFPLDNVISWLIEVVYIYRS